MSPSLSEHMYVPSIIIGIYRNSYQNEHPKKSQLSHIINKNKLFQHGSKGTKKIRNGQTIPDFSLSDVESDVEYRYIATMFLKSFQPSAAL